MLIWPRLQHLLVEGTNSCCLPYFFSFKPLRDTCRSGTVVSNFSKLETPIVQ